jgi:predicted dehydrogenase
VAHFDCALTLDRYEAYEVAGTEGYLSVPSAFLPGTGDVEIVETRGRDGVTRHPVDGVDEYRLMVEHFADCVLHDRPLRYPAAEAAANMRVVSALLRSARANRARVEV